MAYTYQWRSCNSAGTSCSDIVGETSSSYVLTAGDLGKTVRVVVSDGTTTVTSAASAVVGSAPDLSDAYLVDDFSGYTPGTSVASGGTLGPWLAEISAPQGGTPSGSATITTYGGEPVLRLRAGAQTFSGSSGTLQSLYLPNNPTRAGQFLGGTEGQTAWFRWSVLFPAGTQFTTGQWNRHIGWHNDNASGSVAGAVSTGFDVYTDYPVSSSAGANPKMVMRVYGGPVLGWTLTDLVDGAITFDHWYDSLVKITWGTTAATGRFEWYQDTVLKYAGNVPTLYKHTDGTLDKPSFGLYLYRLKVPWVTDYYFKDVAIGPTRASVGA